MAFSHPRLCISSTGGGGGKTLLSLGLGRFFTRAGRIVKPFKKGPDFIDSAWLAAACSLPCSNLDLFFMDSMALAIFFRHTLARTPGALALIEGNRGLYDGLDETGSCSTAAVARTLECPILICLNCVKTTRTAAAILHGLATFESGINIGGVVLNRVGSHRHETALRRAIEGATGIPVLGALPRLGANPIDERHMGLASRGRNLAENTDEILDNLADIVGRYCDTDEILKLAASAAQPLESGIPSSAAIPGGDSEKPRIGYIMDDALWFYYPENIAALKTQGAEPVRLSLLDPHESAAWENLSGLYIGGGFPEDFAPVLSASPGLEKLRHFIERGMPVYAECGGLVVLCSSLELDGKSWPMAGIFPIGIGFEKRPQGLGYVEARVIGKNPFFPRGMTFRGHEFHYSRAVSFERKPDPVFALSRGTGLFSRQGHAFDGLVHKNTLAAYTHIFAPALPQWAQNFVAAARNFKVGDRSGGNG